LRRDPGSRSRSGRFGQEQEAGALPEGDFRDWAEIDAWASDIAYQLAR
jgi:hypothetical protein